MPRASEESLGRSLKKGTSASKSAASLLKRTPQSVPARSVLLLRTPSPPSADTTHVQILIDACKGKDVVQDLVLVKSMRLLCKLFDHKSLLEELALKLLHFTLKSTYSSRLGSHSQHRRRSLQVPHLASHIRCFFLESTLQQEALC
eukprot:7044-Heterococcus_DN1.PRE.4